MTSQRYFASGGSVVKVSAGELRMPRTLICAEAGVVNSSVPRISAVAGYCVARTKEV
jgi:hypothetical protein